MTCAVPALRRRHRRRRVRPYSRSLRARARASCLGRRPPRHRPVDGWGAAQPGWVGLRLQHLPPLSSARWSPKYRPRVRAAAPKVCATARAQRWGPRRGAAGAARRGGRRPGPGHPGHRRRAAEGQELRDLGRGQVLRTPAHPGCPAHLGARLPDGEHGPTRPSATSSPLRRPSCWTPNCNQAVPQGARKVSPAGPVPARGSLDAARTMSSATAQGTRCLKNRSLPRCSPPPGPPNLSVNRVGFATGRMETEPVRETRPVTLRRSARR